MKLSTWTYCAVANGTIGYWDDPAITADNGGTAGRRTSADHVLLPLGRQRNDLIFEYKLNSSPKAATKPSRETSSPRRQREP